MCIGELMKDEFLLCGECKSVLQRLPGTVSFAVEDPGLKPLEAGSQDASKEKHVPVVRVDGPDVAVEVGSVPHPMAEEHHILWVMLRTDRGFLCRALSPGEPAAARFTVQRGEKPVCVYEMCNVHGLWKKDL